MPRSLRLAVPFAALALTAAGSAPALAQSPGVSAKVAGGRTTLALDPATADVLAANGVRVEVLAPAVAAEGGAIAFPVRGGKADPGTLRGDVRHSGGLRFTAGSRSVALRAFTYTIRRNRATLSARVGDGRLQILRLDLSGAKVAKDGLTDAVTGIKATLTPAAASALNRAFHVRLFAGGLSLGTVGSEVRFAEAILAGGTTSLALDSGAGAALASLGIAAAPIGPATAGTGGLAFPITAGRLDAATLAGAVRHSGGIRLARGATRVALRDFTISTDGVPFLSAAVGGDRVRILRLDVSGLALSVSGGHLVAGNVVARLTAAAAAALNRAFRTSAFAPGLVLGTATVDAELR